MLLAQISAVAIFVVMFFMIITEKIERHLTTLISGGLTLLLVFIIGLHDFGAAIETLNLHSFFTPGFWYAASEGSSSGGINWETIVFIAGMMIMVEGMARVGFFRWLCMRIAKMVKYKVMSIFLTFMILSAFLAMFIDSITVILFLAAVTIELSRLLKFNPVPMILSEIFCANLGGSATMCGDPPNIIIGTSHGYSFTDFLTNTGVIAGVSVVAIIIFFYFTFRKELAASATEKVDISTLPTPESAITDKKGFIINAIIFLIAVVLLVTHSATHLTVSCIGVFVSILTIAAAGKHTPEIIKRVDYKTLLFFIGLFIVVGGLEKTHILELLADFIGKISGGNLYLMIGIIIWVSAIASAFVDNIPFAATMIPVISELAATVPGASLPVLSWALAMGTDIGGSATPIGASANVVGIATAAKEGHIIKWGRYCKVMAPATVLVMIISTLMIFVRYL